jgi:hypothetical protein
VKVEALAKACQGWSRPVKHFLKKLFFPQPKPETLKLKISILFKPIQDPPGAFFSLFWHLFHLNAHNFNTDIFAKKAIISAHENFAYHHVLSGYTRRTP